MFAVVGKSAFFTYGREMIPSSKGSVGSSVCDEANTGNSRQTKNFLIRPCRAPEVARADSTYLLAVMRRQKTKKSPR